MMEVDEEYDRVTFTLGNGEKIEAFVRLGLLYLYSQNRILPMTTGGINTLNIAVMSHKHNEEFESMIRGG